MSADQIRTQLLGDYTDEEEALVEGIRMFGAEPLLVRKPGEPEPVLKAPALSQGLL